MEEIWILRVTTSLPDTCRSRADLRTELRAYGGFEETRAAMRGKIRELAFSDNAMFDGAGHLKMFDRFIREVLTPGAGDADDDAEHEEDEEEYLLNRKTAGPVRDALEKAFEGEDRELPFREDFCLFNYLVEVERTGDGILIRGDEDGPWNGYDPCVSTNIFDMREEKNYYLYVEDMFGQDEWPSELYIDLQRNVN